MIKLFSKLFNPEKKAARKEKRKTRRKTRKLKRGSKIIKSALTPEELANLKKKVQQGKIKILKTTPEPKKEVVMKKAEQNFWTDTIDLGFISPTGQQLVIGTGLTIVGGALAYKALKK